MYFCIFLCWDYLCGCLFLDGFYFMCITSLFDALGIKRAFCCADIEIRLID